MSNSSQRKFFNIESNRYPQELILNPPLHTLREIGEIAARLGGLNKNATVADFGAGSGRITIPLLQIGFSVWAIDVSQDSLKNLIKLSKKLNLKSLKVSSSFPRGKKFKAIVGTDILHHVDLDKYLRIIFTSLKKGGKIVFSEPCALNPSWYIYLPFASSWKIEKGIMHFTYFNLVNALKRAGFKNIEISGLGLLPRPIFNFSKILCNINDRIGNLSFLKLFAYRYIIEAEK